jgi:glycosyltransferase involved in cell wall biosynthesis
LFLGRAHAVVAVSEGVADDLAVRATLLRRRISVIYNPVVFPGFYDRMLEPVNHPWLAADAPPFLLAVGRLVEQKDFATLIAAFAIVVRSKNLRLIILGEGPLHDDLMARAESHGVADRVSFAGFQANPLPFMRKAAVLVMSSAYEGFGNVLVEALACGTPVVSTDCPYGPKEILESGRFGRLVPVGDKEAMAEAIIATLEHPLPKEILQARGHEFTVERSADDYLKLFETL